MGVEDVKDLLFLCPKVREVWTELGIIDIIEKACEIARAGEYVLAFRLLLPANEHMILGLGDFPEAIAITSWYSSWEHTKEVHDENMCMGVTELRLTLII